MPAILIILLLASHSAFSADDPRLEIDEVRDCVEQVKLFLRSDEYSGEKEKAVIGACRDVEALCVKEVGESLPSTERYEAVKFLPVVRACRGRGTGKCFRALKDRTPSLERREVSQVMALLKKCE